MPLPTAQQIRDLAPRYEPLALMTDAELLGHARTAGRLYAESWAGDDYGELIGWIALHLAWDEARGGGMGNAKGVVTSERLETAARSYASDSRPTRSRDTLNLGASTFGRKALAIIESRPALGTTVWSSRP